ncbi:helix-turn-helix transcriptional regulator [Streptococcus agalactiae]|uniref:helix-turn-helix domain-containing protein n=1 Tax=Streptococcus agalactiae TaxID=1311 RepID=UPI0002BBDBAA|nr:helix-turn-helix transcriptional regulator [Streptococcus agalactiae]EPU00482.1 XRE family transcriptional regulator [Streptococcus agalactiae BSU108]EPW92162.1 XRE family transcriptional regulator [Streptococcus agalactiae MRI Z1-023]KAF1108774.1 transcriptional regulator [Streptococcus agalactiae]KAF1136750.1 transcriptional regulator [Streptococcus agalactiae]KAF1143066.1 transcriptional regulator [Streptococcus agalactiae]
MKKKLDKILIDKEMTKKELSKKTKISYNTILNIGRKDISFNKMKRIADVLNVSLDEFR